MNNLKDYIITIDNLLTDKLCDTVIKEFAPEEYVFAVIGDGAGVIAPNTRNVTGIYTSQPVIIQKNPEVRRELDKYIYLSAMEAIRQYAEKFPFCEIQQDSGYELLKYEVGQFYTEHTDSFKGRPSSVACSFALNDDYEGGEWAFFNREVVIKLPKGSAVLFPSNFMYPHQIMPVTKGTRYSMITWFI